MGRLQQQDSHLSCALSSEYANTIRPIGMLFGDFGPGGATGPEFRLISHRCNTFEAQCVPDFSFTPSPSCTCRERSTKISIIGQGKKYLCRTSLTLPFHGFRE